MELIRLFKKAGKQVKCIATESAMTFITSASVEYLSGHPLRTSLEDREQEMKMGHIELARWPDLILVAPATANIISSTANAAGFISIVLSTFANSNVLLEISQPK